MRHATRTLCLLVACSLAASVAVAHVGASELDPASKRRLLTVKGHAEGLYPGGSAPLPVSVTNRDAGPLVIKKIKVRAGLRGAACSGEFFSVRMPKRGRIKLRAHSTARLPLSLTMLPSASDACQGATIPLKFKVRATRP